MATKSICAITINYKNACDTARCVQSLCASSVPVDIFVVDNSPNDPLLGKKLAKYTSVTVVRPETNLGFGVGNNLGASRAQKTSLYDYILILNNDATICCDGLQRLLNAASEHPAAGIIAPRIVLEEDPDVLWYGGGEVDWIRAAAVVPGFLGSADSRLASNSRYVTFASGCAMLFRCETWQGLKGFDPRFFMYEEDLEICLRAVESGWKIWYESLALVRHRGQGSFRDDNDKFRAILNHRNRSLPFFACHVIRNRILNVRLHAKGFTFYCAILGLTLFCIKKCTSFVLHCRLDGIKGIIKGVIEGVHA